MESRGERNNNPGNIERNNTKWKGMASDQSSDSRFVVFTDPTFGIRALAKTLLTYSRLYPQDTPQDIDTVREIINRWAPPVENNTESYINAVAAGVGNGPDVPIDVAHPATLAALVKGIIRHENGRVKYSDGMIISAVAMALV